MAALMDVARKRGLARMEGIVLATNASMLRFARQLGFKLEHDPDDRTTMHVVCALQRDAAKIRVLPLTPARWRDLESVFEAKGCSIARGCWCMYYRETGKPQTLSGMSLAESRKEQMRARATDGPPPGLIAYAGKQPVGWVTLGPREEFLKLRRSPVMKPVDDKPVWSIVCFVVPPEHRHKGVATALLRGAVEYAAKQGATLLEAYPIDKAKRGADDWLWHGAKSMYDKAGFAEVARRKPERPVVRLALPAKRRKAAT
jgi:GNAT superfamily N-acetyltransferase